MSHPMTVLRYVILAVAPLLTSARAMSTQRTYDYDVERNRSSATALISFTATRAYTFRPRRAEPGDLLNVYGRNFPAANPAGLGVEIGGAQASIVSVGTRVVTVIVPASAANGSVVITYPGGSSETIGEVLFQSVTVAPETAEVPYGGNVQFAAAVAGAVDTSVDWSVNGVTGGDSSVGTISAGGLYTAPDATSAGGHPYLVEATSAELGISAYALVSLECTSRSSIADETLQSGAFSAPFERHCYDFGAQGGERVYFAAINTANVARITLRASNGVLLSSTDATADFRIFDVLLPVSDTYRIEVEGAAGATGSYDLWLNRYVALPPGTWLHPDAGDWTDSRNWSGGLVPGPTDSPVIPAFPTDFAVRVDDDLLLAGLRCDEDLDVFTADLDIPGDFELNGELELIGASTISMAHVFGSGSIRNFATLLLEGVRLGVTLTASAQDVHVRSGLTVDGAVELRGGAELKVLDATPIDGTGEVAFGDFFAPNRVWSSTGPLQIGSQTTVRAMPQTAGTIGSEESSVVGDFKVLAESGSLVVVEGPLDNVARTLDLQSTGGTIRLNGPIDNANGIVSVAGSTGGVQLTEGSITGGTMSSPDGADLTGTGPNASIADAVVDCDLRATVNGLLLSNVVVNGDVNALADVVLDASTLNGAATVSGGNRDLFVQNGLTLDGSIELRAGAELEVQDGSPIGGTGEVVFGNFFALNRVWSSSGPLQVGADVTVRAAPATAGVIGSSASSWTTGFDVVTEAGSLLTLEGSIDNGSSTLPLAGTGGTVQIRGTIDNANGVVSVAGSTIYQMIDGSITGGSVTSPDGAVLNAAGATAAIVGAVVDCDLGATVNGLLLDTVVLNGDLNALADVVLDASTLNGAATVSGGGRDLFVQNGLTLDGSIELRSGGELEVTDGSPVNGTGEVVFGNFFALNRVWSSAGPLQIGSGVTVRAAASTAGVVGSDASSWTTGFDLVAEPGCILTLEGSVANASNTLSLSGTGGTVQIQAAVDNTNGIVSVAGPATTFQLIDGSITGGTVISPDGAVLNGAGSTSAITGAVIDCDLGATVNGLLLSNVVLNGDLNAFADVVFDASTLHGAATITGGGRDLSVQNGLTLEGSVELRSGAELEVTDGSPIGGSGEVRFGNFFALNRVWSSSGPLVLGTATTVRALASTAGVIGNAGSSSTLQGTVIAESSSQLALHGTIDQAGVLEVRSASVADSTGPAFTQSAGLTRLAGGTLRGSAPLVFSGGVLEGFGVVDGDVMNAAVCAPGGRGAAGSLSITGTYEQTSAGELQIDVGGTTAGSQYDVLAIAGQADLDGSLDVTLIDSFLPTSGDTFTAATYASFVGSFSSTSTAGLTLMLGATQLLLSAP